MPSAGTSQPRTPHAIGRTETVNLRFQINTLLVGQLLDELELSRRRFGVEVLGPRTRGWGVRDSRLRLRRLSGVAGWGRR